MKQPYSQWVNAPTARRWWIRDADGRSEGPYTLSEMTAIIRNSTTELETQEGRLD